MSEKTFDYCYAHTTEVNSALIALERDTHLRTLSPQMISGPYQGMLLQFISHMIQPRRVLEIGTFTGYASICLAQGLQEDGMLHTIEVDEELAWIFHTYINKAGLSSKVTLHNGDAAQIIPNLTDSFDLVFLDAGKLDYPHHFELALAKTRPGGFILADNVLWHGKVVNEDPSDPTAKVLRDFNAQIQADPRVENLLLPLRDGLMIVRKVG